MKAPLKFAIAISAITAIMVATPAFADSADGDIPAPAAAPISDQTFTSGPPVTITSAPKVEILPMVDAINRGVAYAATRGVLQYVSVRDRATGALIASSNGADKQVASESVFKVFVAAYQLRRYGGESKTPRSILNSMKGMIQLSENAPASRYFTVSTLPSIAKAYGLKNTANAAGSPGYWGAARITANDMTKFMYEAENDPQVGPWLIRTMGGTTSRSDGNFNQGFGVNALPGPVGTKQGWGDDGFTPGYPIAINSVGYTPDYYIAILQAARHSAAGNAYAVASAASTYTARLINSALFELCTDFYDVGAHHVHCNNIAWLAEEGITRPTNNYYRPNQPVTRGSMTAFLFRLAHPGKKQPACSAAPFPDVPKSHEFCGYIAWAQEERIAFGYADGAYRPDNTVTRGGDDRLSGPTSESITHHPRMQKTSI